MGLDWCLSRVRACSKYVSGMENIDRGRAYSTNILKSYIPGRIMDTRVVQMLSHV